MSLEHILLGMLREPATGYDLKTSFNEGARYFWSAELSQIYPALQKMEKRGWLKSRREPSEKGPARRVYTRTPSGTRALHAWLQGEPVVGTERFAYIAQLIFLGEMEDLDRTLAFLQQLRGKLAATLVYLQQAYDDLNGRVPSPPTGLTDVDFHEWLCIQLGVRSLTAKLAWCDESLQQVQVRRQALPTSRGNGHV